MATRLNKEEYLVQVTAIEARNLRGKDASGLSDPYVKVSVANLPPQVSTTANATSSMAWNQSFTFTKLFLNPNELETLEILIEVFDQNDFALNPLIGSHSIGLATLYRNMNHEFFNVWLPLLHPQFGSEPQGYLLTSCYIIGKDDQPPIHAINDGNISDDEVDELEGIPEDELTPEQIKARKEKQDRVAEISKPKVNQRGYQLRVNVAKAEDVAQVGYSIPDSFISVRACGCTLTTPVVNEAQKPVYNSKLQFPVFLPLLNDKIVIRVWDQRKGLPDTFIAGFAESSPEGENFNINSLLSKGGNMPYRWINLYGIPKEDRTSEILKFIGKEQKISEGTAYMGKILMSLNLAPNEKPNKGRFPLNSYVEPPTMEYFLFADVYELQDGVDCGDSVWITVSIGPYSQESGSAKQATNKTKGGNSGKDGPVPGSYVWKNNQIKIDEMSAQFPKDQSQIPDIFISLYTQNFWGTKRVAYMRIPANDPSLAHHEPKWYTLKSVENNIDNKKNGYLLLNLHFTSSNKKISRVPKRRNLSAKFVFIAYIHAAYDLAPDLPPEKINPKLEVDVANVSGEVKKQKQACKNPIWEEYIKLKEVDLTENLEFASNITVRVKNVRNDLLSKGQDLITKGIIGEFSIMAVDCEKVDPGKLDKIRNVEPKLHTLFNDGKPQGRVLASFFLIKDPKKVHRIEDYLKPVKKKTCNVDFAIIGLRNLPSIRNPKIHVKIPGYDKEITPVKLDPSYNDGGSNLNYLSVVNIPDIELAENPLYLPPVEVEVKSEGLTGSSLYFSAPLWEYAEWVQPQKLIEVANIFNPINRSTEAPKDDKKKDAAKKKKKFEFGKEKVINGDEIVLEIKDSKDEKTPLSAEPGNEGKKVRVKGKGDNESRSTKNTKADSGEYDDESDDELIARKMTTSESNFRASAVEVIDCTRRDKDLEKLEKKEEINKLVEEIKVLKADAFPRTEEINLKVQKIKKIGEDFVDEERFGIDPNKKNDEYDYGREISKVPMENTLYPPYINYNLFKYNTFGSSSRVENGIVKSGVSSGAVLKGLLRITDNEKEGAGPNAQDKKSHKSKASRRSRASRTSRTSNKNKGLRFIKRDADEDYPYDIFDEVYLKQFSNSQALKIRLYLLRALNLSAQSDVVHFNNYAAGYSAMSSASTYPFIRIGEHAKQGYDLTKEISDERALVPNTLNPTFFKTYELDAQFPQDLTLYLSIMNKNTLNSSLIGSTKIDLEDRYFGNMLIKQRLAYELKKKELEGRYAARDTNTVGKTGAANSQAMKNQLRIEIADITSRLEGLAQPTALVEYRPLRSDDKATSQGNVEMFLEILTPEAARFQPVAKIEPPKPSEYEIRLIIYETFNIPRITRDTISIFVKASYSPEGWSGQETTKETDVHNGSTDGHGIFNWRMKFPLTVPCPFPRLRFAVYDFNSFASDESIGEAAISLKRVLKKLRTEGKYEQKPRRILLSHSNQPNKTMGEVLYSLQIIPKLDADANPVGEAQEDPNENPYLEKPKEGRGIGDFLKGTSFDFSLWSLFGGRIIKIILGVAFSAVLVLILFVKPGILVK